MGDRMPIALIAMENAARAAGLAVDEVGLDKLMEQGKLGLEVFPHFATELRKLANNNNAVSKAIKENFAPALGRATNTLKMLSNEIFEGGLKEGLLFVLNSFTDLGSEGKNLARTIGSVLGGAIVGLTFPFKMLYAIVYDVANFFGADLSNNMIQATSAILGMATGVFVLVKMFRWLFKSKKALSDLGDMLDTPDGKSKRGSAKGGISKKDALVASALVGAPALAVAGSGMLLNEAGKQFATTDLAKEGTESMLRDLRSRASRFQNSNTMQRVLVEVNMNENAESLIDARVTQGLQNEYEGVFETNGGSKD